MGNTDSKGRIMESLQGLSEYIFGSLLLRSKFALLGSGFPICEHW